MAEATTALAVLADTPCAQAAPALAHFEAKWATHREVIDTWLTVQATSRWCLPAPEPAGSRDAGGASRDAGGAS
eukprot:9242-Prymnesium_polylepis.1